MSLQFNTLNPYTEQKISSYEYLNEDQVLGVIANSRKGFLQWSTLSILERKDYLARLKLEVAQRKSDLALCMSREMGKPLLQASTEVEKSLQLIDYCLSVPESLFAEQRSKHHIIFKQALGVIYGIMPWNFPVWQTLRFSIPNLLIGNTVLLKPADNVAGTALILQEAFSKAIDISGVYSNIFIQHSLSDKVLAHPEVNGVSFTGSTRAGKEIAKVAGQYLKKCVLELGGNDAYIICEDADVNLSAQKVYQGRIINSGQSCISAKRVFVHYSIAENFLDRLVSYLKEIQFGDPQLSKNLMGPLARRDLVDQLQDQLQVALAQGAQLHYQKELPKELQGKNFFPPTVLTNIPANGISHYDEFFGPVFSISIYKDDEDALRLANQSPYGLGGAVFTQDKARAQKLALSLQTGSVAINDYLKSAPERPFGGIKNSGYGSELGETGFFEFTHQKVIVF